VAEDRLCEALDVGGFACRDTDTVGDGRGVASGDFDGDNVVDLLFANVGGPNRVCLGDGAGGYTCANINADANDSEAVATGDFDGDGDLDAVFANSDGANRVCLGNGAGGFACTDVGSDTAFSRDVAVGDVNGDGTVDAVFADFGVNRVCLGNGAGGFVCSNVSGDANSSEGVALADLDQDGLLDAVFANTGAVNRVCLGLGGGAFSCSDAEGLVEPTQAVALGDLNGDLVPDAVFANLGVENRLCFGDGNGAFTCDEFKPDLLNDTDVAFGDLEGDGDLDVVFGVLDGPNRVCEADGSGGFSCSDVAAEINRTWGVILADVNGPAVPLAPFFFNEQMWTRPWNFTEFYLPDHTGFDGCDPDAYSVTTGFTNPTARWRLWSQPDGDVSDDVPPPPPDLVADNTGFDPTTGQYGAPRRAGFVYDPDRMDPVYTSQDGVRLHGGWPDCPDGDCDGAGSRPDVVFGAGDVLATDVAGFPVEVPPYTDPFAPFNPQAPDAPRGDLLTFNPAYMDEFRNFGEPLRLLYQQLSNMSMNAREKVYQRAWYQPEYVTKIRDFDDCDTDLSFPAVMQEFTYLMMDTTDNPLAVPVPGSRLGFPIATGAGELPRPNLGGSLPAGGEFGHGLTSFDADFDGFPEAVGLHTELSANDYFSTTFAANRPQPPVGIPVLPLPGALVDFDGDGIVTDTLDADCVSLNGNEMVVMTVESIVLDAEDGDSTFGHAAQFLDHMVVAENITGGSNPRAQLRFYFAGGTINAAVPEELGLRTLGVGSVAVVDRFQNSIEILDPGESNAGSTDGAWFVFVEDVSEDGERVTLTLGRALGATHSAVDDGSGNHDLTPGDPWYLKRFYVDGHEYNVTALMTNNAPGVDPTDPLACNDRFGFITIRTPVPKGNYFNPQDSLFQQGYFLNGLPPQMSVMPPFNVDHTIVQDVERIEAEEFANLNFYDACVGALAAAGPQVQVITEEEPELRFGQELRETYRPAEGTNTPAPRFEDGWETHQLAVTPGDYTEISLPEGETYLLTLNWRSEVSRLAFYGCTRDEPGPFDDEEFPPQIMHPDVVAAAAPWDPALIPAVNRFDPPVLDADANQIQDIVPYFDARCSVTETVRVKLFYDPTEDDDLYVNKRPVPGLLPELDVSIDKQIDTTVAVAGELVSFLLSATNSGPVDAPGVTIVDQLPLGLLFEGSTGACVSNGGAPETIRCDMGPLAAGATTMVTIMARVEPAVPAGTQLENVGRVEVVGAIDANPGNDVAVVSATVVQVADLSIDKTVPVSAQAAGTVLTYTLSVTNDGPSVATGVTIEDQLPAAVIFLGTDRPDLCALAGPNLLRCLVGTMGPGTAIAIDVGVAIPANVPPGTLLVNDASVGGDGMDPDPSDDQDDETVLVEAVADLALSKTAEPNPVNAGERLTFTLTVTNSGPSDAPAVAVVDTLPAEVAYVGAVGAFCSGVPVGASGTLTCQLGALAAGASDSFQVFVDVDPSTQSGTVILNTAVVSGPGSSDPDPGDNDDEVEVDVETAADLSIGKSTVAEVVPGQEFDWTVSVVNDGPGTATGVVVSDTLPAGTTFVSASGASCSGVAVGSTGTLVCSVGTMAPAASVNIDVRLRILDAAVDGQVLTNAAAVGSATNDPDPSDDTVVDTTTVRRVADVSVLKNGPTTAIAGDRITYTIRIDNAGPATATDVVFTDTLPAGSTLVAVPSGCVESPAGVLTCSLGSLAAGGFSVVAVSVALAPSLQQGAVLRNMVVVDTTADDPQPGNDQALHDLDVERQADLSVALADDPDPVAAGASLLYTATVANLGLSDALGRRP
jgi:uncharacterized repeat protein (TIGR01451 family)